RQHAVSSHLSRALRRQTCAGVGGAQGRSATRSRGDGAFGANSWPALVSDRAAVFRPMKRLDASSLHPFVLGFALLGCTPTTTERSATSGDGAPASAAAPSVASPSAGRASGQSVPSAPATNTPHSSVAVPPATLPTAERSASSGSDSAGSAVRACGALGCQRFESAAAAFDAVLATSPRVLGIGEAHAQKGSASVASSTARFMNELLPRLAGKASDLVIELWVAAGNCGTVEKEVAERQKPVVE